MNLQTCNAKVICNHHPHLQGIAGTTTFHPSQPCLKPCTGGAVLLFIIHVVNSTGVYICVISQDRNLSGTAGELKRSLSRTLTRYPPPSPSVGAVVTNEWCIKVPVTAQHHHDMTEKQLLKAMLTRISKYGQICSINPCIVVFSVPYTVTPENALNDYLNYDV